MLDHDRFNRRLTRYIDTILVYVKLVVYPDNVVIVLQKGCELIKQERIEKYGLLESIIPKDRFNLTIGKRFFQHKLIDDPDCFPCFLFGEIVALQGQDIVKQTLVSAVPGFHVKKFKFHF